MSYLGEPDRSDFGDCEDAARRRRGQHAEVAQRQEQVARRDGALQRTHARVNPHLRIRGIGPSAAVLVPQTQTMNANLEWRFKLVRQAGSPLVHLKARDVSVLGAAGAVARGEDALVRGAELGVHRDALKDEKKCNTKKEEEEKEKGE